MLKKNQTRTLRHQLKYHKHIPIKQRPKNKYVQKYIAKHTRNTAQNKTYFKQINKPKKKNLLTASFTNLVKEIT